MKDSDRTIGCEKDFDPYWIQAGRELDALIHHQILKMALSHCYPCYSTDAQAADTLRRAIEAEFGTPFVAGKTGLRGQRWFARYEIDPGNPTEVLAETYPLAICRLVLLRAMERR
ncbi:MAG: hypothetical protein HY735_12820 [Verrucomicrobia bacterium]|nr:hypothetical protein [Verrucomicrobiota bacterium]